MIRIHLAGSEDLAEIVDSLLDAADACERHAPHLARKRRALAHVLGDGLDALPSPPSPDQEST